MDACKPIQKVEWMSSQSGDPYVIFSGGLPQDRPGRSASITVVHGRSTTVLEMEHNVVDFVTLTNSPWPSGKRIAIIEDILVPQMNHCMLIENRNSRAARHHRLTPKRSSHCGSAG